VAGLHEALLRLLQDKVIRAEDPPNQPTAEQLKAVAEGVRRDQAENVYGDATRQLVLWFQLQNGLGDNLDGVTEERTADRLNELLRAMGLLDDDADPVFVVHGVVEGAGPDHVVLAFDVDFRDEQPLGDSALTGGRYEIRYTTERFAGAERGTADLRVAVVDAGGRELVSSDIVYNAGPDVEIDLVVPAGADVDGLSDYEREIDLLAPVLGRTTLVEVALGEPAQRQRDIDFLAGDTGIDRRHVAWLVTAFELSAAAADRPQPDVVYGWLRRGLPDEWEALVALPTTTLRTELVAAVDARIVPRSVLDRLDDLHGQLPNPDRAGLDGLLAATAWPPDRVGAVLAHVDGLDAVSDATLARLVDDGALAPDEAGVLGLSVSLHRLAAGTAADPAMAPSFVDTMLRTEFAGVPGGRLQQARDLALLEPADWQGALAAAGVEPPDGLTAEDHARGLALQAAGTFPDAAFRHRAATVPPNLDDAVRRMRKVLDADPAALTTPFDDLDLAGIPERDIPALRQAHATLQDLANDHPGLGLADVIATSAGDGAKAATRRLGLVADVLARNPDADLLRLDYLPGSLDIASLDFGDMADDDRELVLADLRADQRIHTVTLNPIASRQVKRAGYHSASAMAMRTPGDLAADTGLPQAEARAYHERAVERANAAALDWFRLYEVARDDTVSRVRAIPTRHQFFRQLTGFRELFDDQPWCGCDDCQSVLSPAAYLVDLLHYIERWILAGSFAGQESHPLHLEQRRPDIWDLELTCEATHTPVPTLDIVNAVLERYVRETVGLADTDAVHRHLADQDGALGLPFTMPLERLRALLSHFGVTRHDVAVALGASPAVRTRARLGLSTRDHELITRARPGDGAYLGGIFAVEAATTATGPDAVLPPVQLGGLLRVTMLGRDDLVALLEARFVSRDGSTVAPVDVVMEKPPGGGAGQNDRELVRNLTVRRLDRLHRFLRLWRRLPWTVAELDLVLERLAAGPGGPGGPGGGTGTTPAAIAAPAAGASKGTLERIVDLLDLDAALAGLAGAGPGLGGGAGDRPVDELLALVDTIPTLGLRPDATATSLFDRLFNPAPFVARDGLWPPAATVRFSHPAWDRRTGPGGGGAPGTSSPADNTLTRLLAGLQLADQELVDLVAGLTGVAALDHRPATPTTDESIALSRAAIDVLHRHARVRSLLGVPVADFLGLLRLATTSGALTSADDLVALVELAGWQKTSGFTVEELAHLVTGTPPAGGPDPAARADAVIAAVDPAAVEREADPLDVLDVALGDAVERSADEAAELRRLADPLDAAARAAVVRALRGNGDAADAARLATLVAATLRLAALFRRPVFDLRGLGFVRAHPEVFYGSTGAGPTATGPASITLRVVRNVVAYAARAAATDAGFTTESAALDLDVLDAVVVDLGAAGNAEVAAVLRSDEAAVAALRPHLPALPANPFDALDVLARGLALTGRLGVSGETLALTVAESSTPATTYASLARAAEDVFGAFRAKYPDQKTFAEKVEPYEDELRGRRRDGLVTYITHRWPEPFAEPNDLYAYFLIDVLVGGCARTTPVVAALSSLQLYVERVLMNLERSADWNPFATPVTGVYARFADAGRRNEWQWRKHYRVWEANRKVFLYPENYIEPELRDDKTPLFRELEDALMVQRVDAATLTDAYTGYLSGFDELARLRVAGTYYDQGTRTLHLFGVTQDDAPVFYYRSITERGTAAQPLAPLYTGWQRLEVQITARKVAPILFEGRLYLFWVETATRPLSVFKNGGSEFGGYRHTVRVKYSMLRLDGAWSAPQVVHMEQADGVADARIVEDPLDTTVVDRMRNRLTDLNTELGVRNGEVAAAFAVLEQATRDRNTALSDRNSKRAAFQAPPSDAEKAAMGAALFFLGIPPEVTLASIRYVLLIIWQEAEGNLRRRQEAWQRANDAHEVALGRVRQLNNQIAALEAALQAEVVRVRWDRSERSHKDALDSYRPQGWEWDRVYPDVWSSPVTGHEELRLMLVPRNPPEPLTVEPLVVAGPGARAIASGDLDVSTGVLHEAPTAEAATVRHAPRLNWSAGRILSLSGSATTYGGQQFFADALWLEQPGATGTIVGHAPLTAEVQAVNGWPCSAIVEAGGTTVWMRSAGGPGSGAGPFGGLRLSTSLTRSLAREFWRNGPASLLAPAFQLGLAEARSPISPVAGQSDARRDNPLHPENPFLTYYRETFLHIPFLVADIHNGNQDFAACQSWYHHVFDPTAADGEPWRYRAFRTPDFATTRLGDLLTDDEALAAYRNDPFSPHAIARARSGTYQKSIVMKYVDNLLDWGDALFGQFTTESINEATLLYVMAQEILGPRPAPLGSCLNDRGSRSYRAIRAGLTDVSDFLVELETPPAPQVLKATPAAAESGVLVLDVAPATQVRRSALSVRSLTRPPLVPETGGAGSGAAGFGVGDESGFGLGFGDDGGFGAGHEAGGVAITPAFTTVGGKAGGPGTGVTLWTGGSGTPRTSLYLDGGGNGTGNGDGPGLKFGTDVTPLGTNPGNAPIDFVEGFGPDLANGFQGQGLGVPGGDTVIPFGDLDITYDLHDVFEFEPGSYWPGKGGGRFDHVPFDPVEVVPPKDPLFCVPPNHDLLAYWDRVESRLFNIRNCRDIAGVRRVPSLFAPELDVRMLVRLRAAGLSLEDVLEATAGDLPPYRFSSIIDKAKQYASTVQSFGAQLLSALEKRDAEELAHLRAVHDQNLLKMATRTSRLEIAAAEDSLEALRRQKAAAEHRRDHYISLSAVGSLPQETKQQELQRFASDFRTAAGIAQVVASILTVIPDIGAWTAMKFGGSQLGAAGRAVAEGLNAVAAFNEAMATRSGTEAATQRRDQDWRFQAEAARREIVQLDKQIEAADIRREIALHALDVHERTVAQSEEMFEFFRDKFSNSERYRLLSVDLRRLYRSAFNDALSMARLAEQAFRAERPDDDTMLGGDYWDAGSGGLLAGERLLIDLQALERRYIERNHRLLEVGQSFSLAQLAPAALEQLQLTGECSFDVPEWFFDLSYPGHYRRRLKAVRVTVPCVVGPQTNVAATLRLTGSSIRQTVPDDLTQGVGPPAPLPARPAEAVATSRGQNDAGLFELNFRDERYLPFEGAGAISSWELSLPRTLRPFDYATISDVVVHLDYTAEHHEGLRDLWDGTAQTLLTMLSAPGTNGDEPLLTHRFSLRTDFPDVFHRLVTSPAGTEVTLTIDHSHLPAFVGDRAAIVRTASLAVVSPLAALTGARLDIAREPTGTDPAAFKRFDGPATPTTGSATTPLRSFAVDVRAETAAQPGLFGPLKGRYLLKVTTPGPLARTAAPGTAPVLDPRNLRDITLSVGYRLGTVPTTP
jgi:hypothetical protein